MSRIYDVRTERFGMVQIQADSIAAARQWARGALDVRNPRMTSTQRRNGDRCASCDSRPCCCIRSTAP